MWYNFVNVNVEGKISKWKSRESKRSFWKINCGRGNLNWETRFDDLTDILCWAYWIWIRINPIALEFWFRLLHFHSNIFICRSITKISREIRILNDIIDFINIDPWTYCTWDISFIDKWIWNFLLFNCVWSRNNVQYYNNNTV